MFKKRALKSALRFATKKHKGQFRIGGEEYIVHPIAVCEMIKEKGYGLDYQITALFHDLLEDTNATEADVLKYGNEQVLEAVKLLTKRKGYVMAEYIQGIKNNKIARAVKEADRLHNLCQATVASADFKRRYILETVDWYLDFSPEIRVAVKKLAESLDTPLVELPFLYEPIETWKK